MAVIPAINIPDEDLDDVLEALDIWKAETIARVGGQILYDQLNIRQKIRQHIISSVRIQTKNLRGERITKIIPTVPDADIN